MQFSPLERNMAATMKPSVMMSQVLQGWFPGQCDEVAQCIKKSASAGRWSFLLMELELCFMILWMARESNEFISHDLVPSLNAAHSMIDVMKDHTNPSKMKGILTIIHLMNHLSWKGLVFHGRHSLAPPKPFTCLYIVMKLNYTTLWKGLAKTDQSQLQQSFLTGKAVMSEVAVIWAHLSHSHLNPAFSVSSSHWLCCSEAPGSWWGQ